MINVGIVGYGNLGKQVEKLLLNSSEYQLVGIFSRRNITSLAPNYPYDKIIEFVGKIDFMIMCGGSEKDLPKQSIFVAKHFSIIDTFDTHKKIYSHYKTLNNICKKHKTSAIISCGWDPGLFSIMRCLYSCIFDHTTCFWGKGISMGHTNAIKHIKEVQDAKQYTTPNKKAIKLAKQGKPININLHFRKCYVVTQNKNKKLLSNKIKNIPYYFKGQPTTVKFISQKTFNKNHNNFYHQGQIYTHGKFEKDYFSSEFHLKTSSNPLLTAKIMLAYLNALSYMQKEKIFKCHTPIEIPTSWLYKTSVENLLTTLC